MAWRTFINALLAPLTLIVAVGLIVWQLANGGFQPLVGVGLVVLCTGSLLLGWLIRNHQRKLLVSRPVRSMSRIDMFEFGVHTGYARAGAGGSYRSRSVDREIAAHLHSRRLVILCGERLSGRSRSAFHALRSEFPDYRLICPRRGGESGRPPLTRILTSHVLSVVGRYALWLDDMNGLMEEGFDPRIVERWLPFGMGRVAIGTITPAERARILAAGAPAAAALRRAATVMIETPEELTRPGRVQRVYERVVAEDQRAAAVVELVASLQVLGLRRCSDELLDQLLRRLTGRGLSSRKARALSSGDLAPLRRERRRPLRHESRRSLDGEDGWLVAHPEVLKVVEAKLDAEVDERLLDALIDALEAPGELLSLGSALAVRGYSEQGDLAFARARAIGDRAIRREVSSARARLFDLRVGTSGASLSNAGGLDFVERMGPEQRALNRRLLPDAPHGEFDGRIPPERERWSTRLYRLTVYRALVRVFVLVVLDLVAVLVGSVAALAVRATAQHRSFHLFDPDVLQLVLSAGAVMVAIATWLGLYRPDRARARPQLILASVFVTSVVVAVGFLVASVNLGSLTVLPVLLGTVFFVDCALRYGYDLMSRAWVRSHRLQRRVLILGSPEEAHDCARKLNSSDGRPVQCVAFLSPDGSRDPFCAGDYQELEEMIHELHVVELVIADRGLSTADKVHKVDVAQRAGLDVRFVANDDEIVLGAVGRVAEDGLVHVPAALLSPEALALKRLFDYAVVIVTMPLWASVIGLYGLYSRLRRPGQPIFVTAERVGLGNNGFSMLRLRTRCIHQDGSRGAKPTGRVEAFVERTGLDELAQVANVLRGEMSLVGPRPLSANDLPELSAPQLRTLGVRPGMTGRWQIASTRGASESDMRTMDAQYLRRWRLAHDLDILIRTPVVIARRGFYLGDTELHHRGLQGWSRPAAAETA